MALATPNGEFIKNPPTATSNNEVIVNPSTAIPNEKVIKKPTPITFSVFLNLLYPYCGQGKSKADFVVMIIDHFMPKPAGRKGDGYINPMRNRDNRTLLNYYNGSRPIPTKVSSEILGRANKTRFEEFIQSFTEYAQRLIAEELQSMGFTSANQNNVDQFCADVLESILIHGKYEGKK